MLAMGDFASPIARVRRAPGLVDMVAARSVAVGALVLSIIALPTTNDAFVLPKLLAGQIAAAVFSVMLAVRWWTQGRIAIRRTPLDVVWAFFMLSALASTLLSVNAHLSLGGSYLRYDGFWTLVTYAALFWFGSQLLRDERDVAVVVLAALGGGTAVALIASGQALTGHAASGAETAFSFAGVVRADGLFGNPNSLGMFLAMLVPLALGQVIGARSRATTLAATAMLVAIALGLTVTFSRSAWIGAAAGIVLMVTRSGLGRPTILRYLGAFVVAFTAVVILDAVGARSLAALYERLGSLLSPTAGSGGTRLAIWADTIRLIADRPLFGFGPDTFALVYPHFQTGDWTPGGLIDRAHAELLQIAASQGLIGAGLYLAMLGVMLRSFLRRVPSQQGIALAGAVVAYQVALQFNFTSLVAALPFWLIVSCAMTAWRASGGEWSPRGSPLRLMPGPVLGVTVVIAIVIAFGVGRAYAADAAYLQAASLARAGHNSEARDAIGSARALAPDREVYAAGAGDITMAIASRSGAREDWEAARAAYEDASRLGASDPTTYLRLASAYEHLGRHADADAARAFAAALGRSDLRRPR